MKLLALSLAPIKSVRAIAVHFLYFPFIDGIAAAEQRNYSWKLFPLFQRLQLQFQAWRFTYKLLELMTRLAFNPFATQNTRASN